MDTRPTRQKRRSVIYLFILLLSKLSIIEGTQWDNALSNGIEPETRLQDVQVACGKRHMRVHLDFGPQPFRGLVFSKGHHGHPECVYVKPGSNIIGGVDFDVFYDKCGTKPDHAGSFYENTIVIQYGQDVIEAWDEAKRLRCEWHDAYEKSALKSPTIQLADLEVQELNFQGDNIGCWMEIQEGKGPWARQVSSIVPLGAPLTMVVAIADDNAEFDMRVKSCWAHDGRRPPLHLTDEEGCVLRPKMLTPFAKVKDTQGGHASVVSYSHFYAFKFPDTIEVQMQCVVEICRNGCPKDCHAPTDDHYAASSNLIVDKRPPSPFLKAVTRPPTTTSTGKSPNFVPISLPPPRVHHPHFIPPPPSQRPLVAPLRTPAPILATAQSPLVSLHAPATESTHTVRNGDKSTDPAPVYVPTEQASQGNSAEEEDSSADADASESSAESHITVAGFSSSDQDNTLRRFSAVRHYPQGGTGSVGENNRLGHYWQQQLVSIRPRNVRVRRNVDALGVRGSFRVVAAQDLAFAPNMTADDPAIVYAHAGDVVYGTVCLSALSLAAGLGLLGLLGVCCACIAAYLFWVLRTYSALNRNKCSMS
ncbi:uncharacterized protein LOC111253268 [Varroa destructor]|uniref:ZP domain-containing protein n=1 Tax=Varroa destructor TaxID=109461 RepID=A0A7M7KKB7_VARDE|nr:uncharacterized protein LOC111253268 [Varroa destructor]